VLKLRCAGDIGADRKAAHFRGQPFGRVAVDVGDDDRLRAVGGKPPAQRGADPVRAAGHDNDLVSHYHRRLLAEPAVCEERVSELNVAP
jgi:hypothetical protein